MHRKSTHRNAIIFCNLCSFGNPNKPFGPCFQSTFRIREYFIWATDHWKVLWKYGPKCLFGFPKSSFGRGIIANLSLSNEDFGRMNKRWNQDFRRKHFSRAWVLDFGLRTIEKSVENPDVIFCSSLPLPLPNEDFGRPNQPFRTRFRSTFQVLVLDLGYKTLKSASKSRSERRVRPSKIFFWGA